MRSASRAALASATAGCLQRGAVEIERLRRIGGRRLAAGKHADEKPRHRRQDADEERRDDEVEGGVEIRREPARRRLDAP